MVTIKISFENPLTGELLSDIDMLLDVDVRFAPGGVRQLYATGMAAVILDEHGAMDGYVNAPLVELEVPEPIEPLAP